MPSSFTRPFNRHPILYLLVTLLLIIAIGEAIGWPFLRGPTESFMNSSLERSVKINGPFTVRFIGGIRLKSAGFWISSPDGFDAPYLLDAKDIVLNLRYRDLWQARKDKSAPIRIKTLHVKAADAYLVRHADGNSTWQFDKDPNQPSRPVPTIENLMVQNGKAVVNDPITESDLKVEFGTQEDTGQEGTSKVGATGKFRKLPLQAELVTAGFLPIAEQTRNSALASSKGWVEYVGVRVDFDGSVSDIFGKKNIKGQFAVKGPSLSTFGLLVSTLLPTTAPFTMAGTIEKSDNVWSANIASAHIGASDLYGNFKYDPRPEVPKLEGTLKGKRFYLADLAPAFGASISGTTNKTPDRLFPNRPLNLPSLNRMNALVLIDLDYVDLGSAFHEPITPFRAELNLNKSKLSLAKVTAKTADGTISGVIAINAHQLPPDNNTEKKKTPAELPEWRIDVEWKDINLEKWLQASKDRKDKAAKEGKPVPTPYVTGKLNGRTRLSGKGNSTAELLGSLQGDVTVFIRNGTMSHLIVEALGLDVAQALGVMIKGDQSLPMQCAGMDLKAKQGIVTPDVALVDTPVTLVLADGNINMAQEQYNLRLIAKPKNISPFTVRSPILVKGTFLNPKVSVEPAPIAARALGAVALVLVNPLAAILPFIDPGAKADTSCSKALAEFNKVSAENAAGAIPAKTTRTPK